MEPLLGKEGRIVSGGQTGVDRGALDAAMALGIPHGGWCPRGRKAEDGVIPDRYQLRETDSPKYHVRTEQNVIDSDGTLILCRGELTGGTLRTQQHAQKHGKPLLIVDPFNADDNVIARIRRWLATHNIEVLNVAGPRESGDPGIERATFEIVKAALAATLARSASDG